MPRGCGGLVNCSYMDSPDPVLSYMASPDPVLAKASLDPLSAKAFSKPANSKYSDYAITNYLKSGVYPDGVDKVNKSGLLIFCFRRWSFALSRREGQKNTKAGCTK